MSCRGNFCVDPSRTEACPSKAGASSATAPISGGLGGTTSGGGEATTGGVAHGGNATIGGQSQGGNTGTATRGGGGTGNTTTEGGAGSTGNSSGAGGGTGGVTPSGTGAAAGTMTAGTSGTACSINGSVPSETCTDRPYHADLEAICPTDSYVWVLRSNDVDNLRLENANTARPEIVGTPRDACVGCQLSLDVYSTELSATKSFPLQVHTTPRITTAALAEACVDQLYDLALSVDGGDSSQYVWTASISEDVGLSIENGHLKGLITAGGTTPRDVGVDLTVKDSHCSSDTVHLTLRILGKQNTACPKILIEGTSPDWPAPPACKGRPYSLKVTATDGVPNYSWGSSSVPKGFDFNALTRELAAPNATEPGDFVVQVSDQAGRLLQKTYRIEARDKCWFGYLSQESGAARVQLFDPLLNQRITLPTRGAATESVVDFQFSPDGKSLACRLADTDASKPKRLILIRIADLQEFEATFAGSVTQYAWSGTSDVLAVAHGPAKADTLGGITITADWATLSYLDTVPAAVDTSLIWFGRGEYVAFDAVYKIAALRVNYSSKLLRSKASVPSGFEIPLTAQTPSTYLPPVALRPSPSGYFALAPQMSKYHFYPIGADSYAFHANVALAERGDFVGIATSGELKIYRPESNSYDPNVKPWASATGCDSLLAWASNANRIACLAADRKTVNLFTYSDATPEIASVTVGGVYDFGDDQWQGHQRMLARSGQSLTFTTAKYIYVTSRGDSPITVRSFARSSPAGIPESVPNSAAISYSPNEDWVVVDADSYLDLCPITNPEKLCTKWLVHRKAVANCTESVLSNPNWCGAPSDFHGILWSPDSRLVGLQADDGALQLMDVRTLQAISVNNSCGADCVGGYQFQP